MDTIAVPGVSANAIAVDGANLRVVTGYKGGVYTIPTSAFGAEVKNFEENIPYSENFGGKYIVGDRVLRSNDEGMQIVTLDGTVRNNGAALVSAEKQAETYNPETGQWTLVQGTNATHYGKHTMAVDGNHTYVAGGVGSNGKNGLRVYNATSVDPVWENGTNTTAVCVEGDYVYAATGAGLRVYEKFNGVDLPLYAFEVLNYDENGMAAPDPDTNKPVAGTDAHSNNFVAVANGYIFVACGQSGVYVFKLNTEVAIDASLKIPSIDHEEVGVIEPGEPNKKFTIPTTTPTPGEDEEFVGWSEYPDKPEFPVYKPGQEVTVTPDKPNVELKPVFVKVVMYTLNFNGWEGKESEIENVPAAIEQKNNNTFKIPENVPVWGERNFCGWYIEAGYKDFEDPTLLKPGAEFTLPADVKEFTLYGVWSSNMSGATGEEKPVTPTPPVIGGEDSNGKG